MKQLKMLRPSAPVVPRALPEGYRIVAYRGADGEVDEWGAIVAQGLVRVEDNVAAFGKYILRWRDLRPEEDLFFVVDPKGKRVATIVGLRYAEGVGYIHMVGSLPECRGKGIGHAMLAHALAHIEELGVTHTVLTTDDYRLPAIKQYLDAGFLPVLREDPDSDMVARWDKVLEELNYRRVEYLPESIV